MKILSPLGMFVGSSASDIYHDMVENPYVKSYFRARKIKDEDVRHDLTRRYARAWYHTTLASKEWWKEKYPTFASLLVASQLSGIVNRVFLKEGILRSRQAHHLAQLRLHRAGKINLTTKQVAKHTRRLRYLKTFRTSGQYGLKAVWNAGKLVGASSRLAR